MYKQFGPALPFKRLELLRKILKDGAFAEKPDDPNHRPLRAIMEFLAGGPNPCRAVVLEEGYIDKDYQDEYAVFYSKTFRGYPSRCERYHFFACAPAELKDLEQLSQATKDKYLGFLVVRPTNFQHVGRTILAAQMRDPHREFVHVLGRFTAHIYGQELKVWASPFIQQDTQVGACAHASLWMLARYMSVKFRYREYLPSEINSFAKQHQAGGRSYPAELGLQSQQILDALHGMGLAAISYSRNEISSCAPHIDRAFPAAKRANTLKKKAQNRQRQVAILADLAYRYIESSLPVIFLTKNHALLGIGHTYQPDAKAQITIQRIPSFITNNDNCGPYQEVPLLKKAQKMVSFSDIEEIIAILPHEVSLRGEDAEAAAQGFVTELIKNTPAIKKTPMARYFDKLEYRTYLMRSVEWQAYLRGHPGMDKRVVGELIKLDYPKFIWVTEVSTAELLVSADREKRQCLGHIMVDSTGASMENATVLGSHFSDTLVLQSRNGQTQATTRYVGGTTPFPHMLRTEDSRQKQPKAAL